MARKRRTRGALTPASVPTQPIDGPPQSYSKGPLRIRLYGDAALRQKALPVVEITEAEQKLADDMLATMYAAPNGIGLAATQVGVMKRLIVIDAKRDDPASRPLVLFNPEIETLEGEVVGEEGCLSFPEITADVKRAAKAVVSAQDIDGETVCVEGEGLLARALQHEIDHLNGVLFIDHVNGLKRQLLRGKLRRLKEQSQSQN